MSATSGCARDQRTTQYCAEAVDAQQREVALAADLARVTEELAELKRDREARNKIDPVTRLHNLCDHLAEQRKESPYDEESWRLLDEERTALAAKLARCEGLLRETSERLRYHYAKNHYADDVTDANRKTDARAIRNNGAYFAEQEKP